MPNKSEFVALVAERLDGDRKRAAAALDAVIDTVYATIERGQKVAISGFGVFERRDRSARTARNPATGEPVEVAASRVPAFRPGAKFKAIANSARDAQSRATAAVKKSSGKKAAPTAKKSSSTTKKAAPAKKTTKTAAPAKKTTKKSAAKASAKKSAAKASAKKSTAKKTAKKK